MNWSRQALVNSVILAIGAAFGLLLADSVDRAVELRGAKADLMQYAARLQHNAVDMNGQAQAAIYGVLADRVKFCSPEEITFMRGIVYNSSQIKDIGRLDGRTFYCSSETGKVDSPFLVPAPDRTFRSFSVYASVPIMFGNHVTGFVVQWKSVNVLLNPHAFDEYREPPRQFAAFLFDSTSGTLVQGFGDRLPISTRDVIQSRSFERGGVLYIPLCSDADHVCVVAAESLGSLLGPRRPIRLVLLLLGGALGLSLTLCCMLFYRRHRSQEHQLRRAIARKSLKLVYQPIVDLSQGRTVAAEALLRWTNEDHEVVSPEVFVALAEAKGLIRALTRMVISQALKEMAPRLRRGDFRLTVNVSADDLADARFLVYLRSCLLVHQIEAASVGLELRERTTNNNPAFIEHIAQLRRAGHAIYLDDFGTGYSSLSYLRDLSVDAIKIDRAFSASIGTDAITESILPQILAMADLLHLDTVVEGIETAEQATWFQSRKQQVWMQGWYFGKPLPAREFLATLE